MVIDLSEVKVVDVQKFEGLNERLLLSWFNPCLAETSAKATNFTSTLLFALLPELFPPKFELDSVILLPEILPQLLIAAGHEPNFLNLLTKPSNPVFFFFLHSTLVYNIVINFTIHEIGKERIKIRMSTLS